MDNPESKSLELYKPLSPLEQRAYEKWLKKIDDPIPIELAIDMYALYVNGHSCEKIFEANDRVYPLGQIVDAKIRYNWDERKDEHLNALHEAVTTAVIKAKSDVVTHLADMLAVAHKKIGTKLQKYLQTGDESLLGGFDPSNLTEYSKIVAMLNAVVPSTKEGSPKRDVKVEGQINHVHTAAQAPGEPKKQITSTVAADLLKTIEEGEIVK